MPAPGVMLKDGLPPAAADLLEQDRMTFAFLILTLEKAQHIGLAILGLGLLIFLHELGHFIAAKRMAMPVETFSIGFGPRLFGFAWRETDVRLSAIPLGGYVKLAGFNPEEPGAEDPHGFLKQPFGKRMLFYSGGILMNLLVAFLFFGVVGMDQARVTKFREWTGAIVEAGSPADQGGLRSGDELIQIGPITQPGEANWEKQVLPLVRSHAGQAIPFQIQRGGQPMTLNLTPVLKDGVGRLGFGPAPFREPLERRGFQWKDIGAGSAYSLEHIRDLSGMVFRFLKTVVSFKAKASQVSGPAGMVGEMAKAAGRGWLDLIYFCAAISLQLAILNALPIPMLDGGHMILLTIEKLRRRDLSMELKERILQGGFILLMSLMGLVVFLDFMKMRK